MFCRNCGATLNENQEVCLKCGVKAGVGNSFCANCGNSVNANADVCLNCGGSLKKTAGNGGNLNGKDKMTIALICFFFGSLGIHNFMMGETKKGIIKIVLTMLCGIGFVFALIDFIKILTDKYVCDPA